MSDTKDDCEETRMPPDDAEGQGASCPSNPSLWALLLIAVMTVCTQWAFRHTFLEDAFMHVRYAHNALESGVWACWNVGEKPVSGESSPLWLALLVFLGRVGFSPLVAAKLMGGLALFGCCVDLVRIYNAKRTTAGRFPECLFALSLFTLVPMLFYSISGMEAVLFVYLLQRLLLTPSLRWHAVVAILVTLARPEGALFVLVLTTVKWWRNWKTIALAGFPAFCVFVAYLLFHRMHFGSWLPNTYYAKADLPFHHSSIYALRTVAIFLKDYYFVVICAALFLLSRRLDRIDVRFVALMATSLLFVIKVGGDNAAAFPHHRHLLPVLACAWLYAFLFVEKISIHFRFRTLTSILFLSALFVSHYASESGTEHSPFVNPKAMIKKLFHLPTLDGKSAANRAPSVSDILRALPDGELVATGAAGRLPATFLNLRFVDMFGLNDEHIARYGTRQYGQVDTKTDFDYVLNKTPAVIQLPIASHFLETDELQRGRTHWRNLVDEMLGDARLSDHYWLVPSSALAIFVHTRALAHLPEHMQVSARKYTHPDLVQE